MPPAEAVDVGEVTGGAHVPELDEARECICRLLRERMAVEIPSVDTDLFESGLVDSLAFIELLAGVEEELSRRIALEELELDDLRSVDRIAHVVVSCNGSGS